MIEEICVINSKKEDDLNYQDALCKREDDRAPNQTVCPLGKVFCPDLTCEDDHSEYPLYPVLIAK